MQDLGQIPGELGMQIWDIGFRMKMQDTGWRIQDAIIED